MAAINKPTARLETSTSTRFFNLKPIEKFDCLKFPINGEDAIFLPKFFLESWVKILGIIFFASQRVRSF